MAPPVRPKPPAGPKPSRKMKSFFWDKLPDNRIQGTFWEKHPPTYDTLQVKTWCQSVPSFCVVVHDVCVGSCRYASFIAFLVIALRKSFGKILP